jgi:Protein of unknown function (DUF3313)
MQRLRIAGLKQLRVAGWPTALIALLFAASALAQPKNLEEAMSYDGLQKITVKGIDMAFARPGATLSGYTKVLIAPVDVVFHKDWNPTVPGRGRKLSTDEQQKIRTGVAKIVYGAFVEQLSKGGYTVVTDPGPDVLGVTAKVLNLYVTAPDVMTPGRSRTYTVSAGEMTLLLELSDSETGEVAVRLLDRYQSRGTGGFTWSSSVSNAAEAQRAADGWAKILRSELDKAKTIGGDK